MIIGPALFWAAYHLYKDRFEPEPFPYLAMAYLMGIAAGYVAAHGYVALGWIDLRYDAYELSRTDLLGLWWYSVLAIGLIEEGAKMLPFVLVVRHWRHFSKPPDGIIYASFIALGFASHENLFWLPAMAPWEALGRSVASPLIHVMFASIWGFIVARACFAGRRIIPAALAGLALAALVHGLFDFITIGLPQWVRWGPPLIILVVWIWRMHVIRRVAG